MNIKYFDNDVVEFNSNILFECSSYFFHNCQVNANRTYLDQPGYLPDNGDPLEEPAIVHSDLLTMHLMGGEPL